MELRANIVSSRFPLIFSRTPGIFFGQSTSGLKFNFRFIQSLVR